MFFKPRQSWSNVHLISACYLDERIKQGERYTQLKTFEPSSPNFYNSVFRHSYLIIGMNEAFSLIHSKDKLFYKCRTDLSKVWLLATENVSLSTSIIIVLQSKKYHYCKTSPKLFIQVIKLFQWICVSHIKSFQLVKLLTIVDLVQKN